MSEHEINHEAALEPPTPDKPSRKLTDIPHVDLPDGAQARLEITAGIGRDKCFAIKKSLVVLGRTAESADIVVPSPMSSRQHAAIAYDGENYVLYDLGSRNGTLLNGEQVSDGRVIEHGSDIQIGDSTYTFWND